MSISSAKRERVEADPIEATRDRAWKRYRQEDFTLPGVSNETLDILFSHRSVRAYLPDALPEGTLETLVTAAQSASSSSNLQAWSVIAIEDVDRKARLAALANNQKHILQAPLLLIWVLDLARLDALAKERGHTAEGLSYTESFLVGAVDTSLAAQNAVVALESLGLGTVYIGAIRNKPIEVAKELGLPPNSFPLFGLLVGKPDHSVPSDIKPRLPQQNVLFREQYAWGEAQRAGVAAYDERIQSFQREQNVPELAWSEQALKRVKDAPTLHGRERLRDVLKTLGFGLN
ncbi:MAG: NADPH-dependent oxidoreductase [Pseudomonadota bacterium]